MPMPEPAIACPKCQAILDEGSLNVSISSQRDCEAMSEWVDFKVHVTLRCLKCFSLFYSREKQEQVIL